MPGFCGPLAQLVEQKTFNLLVDGSNPSRPTTYKSEEVRHSPEFGIQHRISRGFLCALVQRCPVESGSSEEHTSALQSLMRISYAVFSLKQTNHTMTTLLHHCTPHKHPS